MIMRNVFGLYRNTGPGVMFSSRTQGIFLKQTIVLFLIFMVNTAFGQNTDFKWPGHARAAVCMTYDDGMDTHLDVAIPDLDQHGICGTFYLTGQNVTPGNIDRWREAANKGHELGNHSAYHPCPGREHDWVWHEYSTETYTVRRMLMELEVMNSFLYAIDAKTSRTYAYPCGTLELGAVNYVDSLRVSGLFPGARSVQNKLLDDMEELDFYLVPGWVPDGDTPLEELIEYAEQATEKGTIAVFIFHGVGGEYSPFPREVHNEFARYLSENQDRFWVAPLVEILDHVENQLK
jgi:peptidoglycan/xylan/chitin deacetylase (PgdA/CDA1 family)